MIHATEVGKTIRFVYPDVVSGDVWVHAIHTSLGYTTCAQGSVGNTDIEIDGNPVLSGYWVEVTTTAGTFPLPGQYQVYAVANGVYSYSLFINVGIGGLRC